MQTQISVSSGKGFQFVESVLSEETIHETAQQRITLKITYVPDAEGKDHHVSLKLQKFQKNPKQGWDEAKCESISLTSQAPQQSLNKLIDAIKVQKQLRGLIKSTVVVLNEEEANLFKQISSSDMPFLLKVLNSFSTPVAQRLLIAAKKEDINNLYAAVRHAKNKSSLDELKTLIESDALEGDFQRWFQANSWAFGVEYLRIYDSSRIGIHSDSDFIAETTDRYSDLIELKRPSMELLKHDLSHDSYYPSVELSKVIGQAVKYLHIMEVNRENLRDEDEITVLKPRIKIIAGSSLGFNPKQKQALRLLNNGLHGIEIITYDQIIARSEKLLQLYSK